MKTIPSELQTVLDFFSKYTAISSEELVAMMDILKFMTLDKNELLLRQGEISNIAGFLIKGVVRSYYIDGNGEEHTLGFNFENEPLLSIESFFRRAPSSVNSVTLEPTEILYATHTDFFGFIERFPKYETILRKIMSDVFTIAAEHNRLLRIGSSRERYEELCRMRPDIIQRVPLKYIASYLEMAFGTLSRVRAGKL